MITGLVFDVQSDEFSDAEQGMANKLGQKLEESRGYLLLHLDYYEGEQVTKHLGISIPENLESIRAVVGWPRLACDALDEKLEVSGFMLPGSSTTDEDLWDIWCYNGMEAESSFAHLDALIYGRGFGIVGTSDTPGMPLITVESPINMHAEFDAASRQVTYALQAYNFMGAECAALYTPTSTVHLVRYTTGGAWELLSRDDHNLGFAPVVMLTNRSKSNDRYGKSEITPEVMSLNDAACRTVLGMEISREFFGAPQRYILGASEEAFQKPDGTAQSAWQTYLGRILALEPNEDGAVPTVGQFTPGDPTVYTTILQDLSKRFAAVTGLPPHMVGYSADNPASAEGINSAEGRLNKRARRKMTVLGCNWRDLMIMALKLSGRVLPEDAHQLKTQWCDPSTPTPADDAMFVGTLVTAGVLPATSSVTLERAGFSPQDIERIGEDHDREQNDAALNNIMGRIAHGQQSSNSASGDSGPPVQGNKPGNQGDTTRYPTT